MAWKIKKGDQVYVIAGDYKGNKGKVLSVNPKTSQVIVEGVNLKTHHMKPSVKYPDGGIVKKESFIHISNVALVTPGITESLDWSHHFVTRVGFRFNDQGKKVRYAKRNGKEITQESV